MEAKAKGKRGGVTNRVGQMQPGKQTKINRFDLILFDSLHFWTSGYPTRPYTPVFTLSLSPSYGT